MELHRFPLHFGLQNTPPNHLKIDSGSFWRQSGIDLVLQGRICMDSERPGLDFSLIWVRFLLDFWMYRAWLLQTIAGHILYSALACAKTLLELLQETAARITWGFLSPPVARRYVRSTWNEFPLALEPLPTQSCRSVFCVFVLSESWFDF